MNMHSRPDDYVLLAEGNDGNDPYVAEESTSSLNLFGLFSTPSISTLLRLIGAPILPKLESPNDRPATGAELERLTGKPAQAPVTIPEILISQHHNALQFHYANYTRVKTNLKHVLRDKNAAIAELCRLTAISEGRGENLITAYIQVVEEVLPNLNSTVFNLAKPTIKVEINNQLEQARIRLQTKQRELSTLKTELQQHAQEIVKCYNEIKQVKLPNPASIPESKEADQESSRQGRGYLQMSH
jgi:hypothetical protein